MNTHTVGLMTIVAALCVTACASATAAVTPSATPAPTDTPVPPTLSALPPSPTPGIELSRRGYHAAAYDSKCDRVIVFGGWTDPNHGLSDTWTYNIAADTWIEMSQSPGQFDSPSIAYDSASDRTVLFGGNGVDNKASQTWAYDCTTNTWTDLKSNGPPSDLLGARMVYDSQSDRMILFGGLDWPPPDAPTPEESWQKAIFHNETWAYDFHTNTWTNMRPKTSPPGRNYFQMAYDTASDRTLVWGKTTIRLSSGREFAWGDDDIWAYDFETNTWTTLKSVQQPTIRHYGAMIDVPTMKRVLLFGGVDSLEKPLDDMWAYDSTTKTWEQVRFDSGPSARGWHTLTYSTKSDRIVLIGGGMDRDHFTNEVWIFDPHAKTWTQVGPR